jgi:hypothetical protein
MAKLSYDQHPFDSKSQIRLLKFDKSAPTPWQWSFTEPVTIRSRRKVEPACQFTAASYEWGAPHSTKSFTIHGQETTLRRNLFGFLETLSGLANNSTKPLLYWIDSICINQDDQKEKTNQIELLRDIYRSASSVLSWLGPMANGSNLAMKYLRGISIGAEDSINAYLRGVSIGAEDSINALLNRKYWTRLWMVQEVVLGSRWYIMCGSDVIDGEDLIRLFNPTNSHDNRRASQWKESKAHNFIRERLAFQRAEQAALVDLVLRFYWLESEFRVDKFRALLALSDPDTVGNMHKLLTRFVDSDGNSDRLTTVTQDICDEMCRLAGVGRSNNVTVFVSGILRGTVEKPLLDLMANNLRVFRMSKQRTPSPTAHLSRPTKSPPLPTTGFSTPTQSSAIRSVVAYNVSDLKRFPTGSQLGLQKRTPIASELGRTMTPYQPVLPAPGTQATRSPLETIQRQVAQNNPSWKPSNSKRSNVSREERTRTTFAVPGPSAPISRSQTPFSESPFQALLSGAPSQTSLPKLWDDQTSTTSHETSRSVTVQNGVVTKKRGQLRIERRHDVKPKRKKTEP